ncbi:YxeA family protein, partial [Salmonella enterica subsp. enterica serovar Caracas]|nr:YxeA family protein [Salmonella enterica subsp. enterica serovar Caracas]
KIKRVGCDQYYVKISTEQPEIGEYKYWKYIYQLDGYSDNGKKRLSFTSDRVLRPHAYLRVYVCTDNEVISWEEILPKDIPFEVKKYLSKKSTA